MCHSLAAQPVVLGAGGLNVKQAVGSASSERAANNSLFLVIVLIGTLHMFPYCAENRYNVHVALSILVGCLADFSILAHLLQGIQITPHPLRCSDRC